MVVRLCALPCLATLQWQWRFINQSVDWSAWSQQEGNQAVAQVQYRLDCGHAQIRVPLVVCGESVKMRPVRSFFFLIHRRIQVCCYGDILQMCPNH